MPTDFFLPTVWVCHECRQAHIVRNWKEFMGVKYCHPQATDYYSLLDDLEKALGESLRN